MRGERASALGCVAVAFVVVALTPATAGAETRQFFNADQQYPSQNGGLDGPSTRYPSTISVSGLDGTVSRVTVTVFIAGSGSPDDIDMAVVGPNGQQVMLMSDSCGVNPETLNDATWTFDDAAPTFVSNGGPCPNFPQTYKPSNYEDPALDNLGVSGGPAPPYLNALSFLAGGSPNGDWRLFVLDDNNVGFVGFGIIGWALTLEIADPAMAGADTTAPDTQITAGPKRKSKKRRATFSFTSSEPGSRFECSLDGASFAACASPLELKAGKGKHRFDVRAVDAAGNLDPTPAVQRWKVKK